MLYFARTFDAHCGHKTCKFSWDFCIKIENFIVKTSGCWWLESLALHNFQWQSSPKNPPQKIPSLTFLLNVSLLIKFQNLHVKKNLGRLSTPTKQQTVASFDTNQEVSIRFWSILMSLQTSDVAFDKWVHSHWRGIIIIRKTK